MTTKKKAKAPTLAQRVATLEKSVLDLSLEVVPVLDKAEDRLTALEQAQRPAEKPAAEKRAGPWVSAAVLHTAEEDRLKEAVVDAALAWRERPIDMVRPLEIVVEALARHRAKKGGAS